MFSAQTRQALRVLWWRGLDHAEDVGRFVMRRPRVMPDSPLTQNRLDAGLTTVHDGPMTNETAPFIEASVNVTHRYIQLDVGKTDREATVKMDVDQAQNVLDQLESAINAYYAA